MSPSLLVGVMLVAAVVGGYAAQWVRLPRVIGYIVAGIVLKLFISKGYGHDTAVHITSSLTLVTDLTLGLILFTIGRVFDRTRLQATGGSLWRLSLWEIALTFGLTSTMCGLAVAMSGESTWGTTIAGALLLGTVAVVTAPGATWLVINEYQAKGITTDHLLGMTGINNLISIISFTVIFLVCTYAGWIESPGSSSSLLWLDLLFTSVGSIALGSLLGVVLSILHSRLAPMETVVAFIALLLLLATGDDWLKSHVGVAFNPMIVSLVIGAVFINLGLDTRQFEHQLESISSPLFGMFFVLAGYKLHFEQLGEIGILGVTYILMRTLGKILGIRLGTGTLTSDTVLHPYTGMGMLCQGGVAIGLGIFLVEHWEGSLLAHQINTVILASVTVFELTGPLLVKHVVVRAGEVKLVTLMRPITTHDKQPGPSAVILQQVRRLLRFGRPAGDQTGEGLQARHLMRTNVQFLPEAAPLVEVLHFVERSRFSDFPVVDDEGRYVGVVHFRSIRDMMYDPTFADLVTAGDLADQSVPVVTSETSIQDLLEVFHTFNLGAVPVVDTAENKRILGLVEQRDLLQAYHSNRTS